MPGLARIQWRIAKILRDLLDLRIFIGTIREDAGAFAVAISAAAVYECTRPPRRPASMRPGGSGASGGPGA